MSAKPFKPTPKQKFEAIEDIVYEYANLMAAGHYSINGQAPWRTNCNDAFLLGCRKLGDFLLKVTRTKKRNGDEFDDVLAVDYLSKPTITWELPIWTAEWKDAMNKQLAHISSDRNKPWDHRLWVEKLILEFNKAWWDFCDAITDRDYIEEFERQLKRREEEKGWGFQNIDLRRRAGSAL